MLAVYLTDPPRRLSARSDSTVELMRAQQRAGDDVYLARPGQLTLSAGGLTIEASRVRLSDDDDRWLQVRERAVLAPRDIDIVFMRAEPPVDEHYRTACQLLSFAADTLVVNAPDALLTGEEKLAAQHFAQLCPPTLVSSDRTQLLKFAAGLQAGCMVKPLNGFGGRSVFAFAHGDSNLAVAIDTLLAGGGAVLVQQRLEQISAGDRRVLMIDGEPFAHMVVRVPAPGSHLGNMVAGGIGTAAPLGAAEKKIATALGGRLREAGVLFAGIDVIGGQLTEINITCPTGLRAVRDQTGDDPAARIVECARRKA